MKAIDSITRLGRSAVGSVPTRTIALSLVAAAVVLGSGCRKQQSSVVAGQSSDAPYLAKGYTRTLIDAAGDNGSYNMRQVYEYRNAGTGERFIVIQGYSSVAGFKLDSLKPEAAAPEVHN